MKTSHLAELDLQRVLLCNSTLFSDRLLVGLDQNSTVRIVRDTERKLRMELESFVLGVPKHEIDIDYDWPADWWQAIKDRWFPAWARRRWPIRYSGIHDHQVVSWSVCPHLGGWADDLRHIQWLLEHNQSELLSPHPKVSDE